MSFWLHHEEKKLSSDFAARYILVFALLMESLCACLLSDKERETERERERERETERDRERQRETERERERKGK